MNPKPKLQNPKSAAAIALALLLASSAAAQPFPGFEAPVFPRGGLSIPQPGTGQLLAYTLGQPIVGVSCAAMNNASRTTLGVGFVPCLVKPTCDLSTTAIRWDDHHGCWCIDAPNNWDPDVVPNNTTTIRYDVTIEPFTIPPPGEDDPMVTLGFGPRITNLTLGLDSTISVNPGSGGSASLTFLPNPGPTGGNNAISLGTFEVVTAPAGDELDLLLNGMNLDQTGGGSLIADGSSGVACTLTLVRCRIRGGTLTAAGQGRIAMLESIIENCDLTSGGGASLVVQPGAGSTLRGVVDNGAPVEIAANAQLAANSDGASVSGGGSITLASAGISEARLGGPDGVITNGAAHTVAGVGRIVGRLLNEGTIDANVDNPLAALTIAVPYPADPAHNVPGFDAPFANQGTMQATGGGTLRIASPLDNRGELIAAADSQLEIASQISGGHGSGGQMVVQGDGGLSCGGHGITQDCVEITPSGNANFLGSTLMLGNLRNSGTMIMSNGSSATVEMAVQMGQFSSAALLQIEGNSHLTAAAFTQHGGTTRLLSTAELQMSSQAATFLGGDLFAGGTITGALNNVGATVHPGNSVGTMTVTEDYTQSAGGTLEIEIVGTPTSAHADTLQVGDQATLGGELVVAYAGTPPGSSPPDGAWMILTADQVIGTFATVQLPTPATRWRLTYLPTGVQVCHGLGCPCPGDLDGDRQVAISDLARLLSHFGTPSGAQAADGDLNGDGAIALDDLSSLLSRFGTVCP